MSSLYIMITRTWYCSHTDVFFFFNDTATTEIYTLSLHDALPILKPKEAEALYDDVIHQVALRTIREALVADYAGQVGAVVFKDRKSTRLNSSHANISYAVFCLKKKKNNIITY